MKFNLHIERLILDDVGIQPQQKHALKEAVVAALRQQLATQGIASMAQEGTNRATVEGGSISIENSHGAESLGQQIGNAVYQGIGR